MTAAQAESGLSQPSIAQAFAHFQQGRLAEAETICTAILAAEPQHFDSLHLLGLLRHRQGRNAEALRLVAAVLKRAPRSAEVLNNYGLILGALKRHEEALACFEDALACCADYPLAQKNRAASLKSLARHEEALGAFAIILSAQPDDIDALNECGGLLLRLGCPDAAVACYDKAIAIAPDVVELHVNKGTALGAVARFDEALQSFAAAVAIDPQCADAHHRSSLIRLRRGDFKNGWRDYEWRWRTRRAPKVRRVDAPLWRGEQTLQGKTILLPAEQGFGDTFHFIRYVPLVAALGATVILDVPPPLQEIAAGVAGVASVLAENEPTPPVDCYCPLLSLPAAFQTEVASIPANVPYIRPSPERLAKWRDRLPQNGRLRIGLCWAGSREHLNDHNRSIAPERFADLFALPNLDFISVQKDVAPAQAEILHRHHVLALGHDFENFADTAAVLAQLDLLLSVDTSVAHLAGAMGKAVALLLPFPAEWRWLSDRTRSPWYPTMRLFRQTTAGDWDLPLQQLHQELSAVAGRKPTG
ncbi:MAG TPA: tetratricopeptide repeat-containing glycosyltransferase family protein [Xanthobacteraceae bacterium]|nr:tetratricopeptide repeat-containing glycosyltransferase family protein [Xanthobacteraceae bacterium]